MNLPASQAGQSTDGRRRLWATVSARLILLTLVALLPLAATMLYLVYESRGAAVKQAGARLDTMVRFVSLEMSQSAAAAEQLILALARDTGGFARSTATCSRELADIVRRYPVYAHLFSTDREGNMVCSSRPLEQPVNISDRDYFAGAISQGDPVMSSALMGRVTGRYTLTYAVAMRDSNGQPLGVIGASIDLVAFLEELDRVYGEMVPGTVLTIWNPDGDVVARVPDREGLTGTRPADSDLYKAMVSGHRSGHEDLAGLDGVKRHYAFAAHGPHEARMWISAGIPTALMLEDVRRISQNSVVAIFLVGILSLLLAQVLGQRSVIRPVRRLSAAFKAISEGQHNVRVGYVGGAVEISELGNRFNDMATALDDKEQERGRTQVELEQARDELDSTVRHRTAQLARAIEVAEEKADSLEKRRIEDQLLNELSSMLQSCRSLSEAFPLLARYLPRVFHDRPGCLFIFRESGNALDPVASWGRTQIGDVEPFGPDECWALRLAQKFHYDPEGQRPSCAHVADESTAYSCTPLLAQNKTLGLLYLVGADAETGDSLVAVAADRVALALGNVMLRESLRDQSIRDPLTGLYNRRYVEETLAREAQRSQRLGKPLSVMMIDIDHFKLFNDTYGHDAGDAVLRAVSSLLKKLFRGSDIACRLGGEEFLVILPDGSSDGAVGKAEELRRAISSLDLAHLGKTLGSVTVSIGVATFPEPIAEHEALIDAADAALYLAKHEGRNCVRLAAATRR